MKQSKTKQNEDYIANHANGREHVFLSELPYPESAYRAPSVLAIRGQVAYLRTKWDNA